MAAPDGVRDLVVVGAGVIGLTTTLLARHRGPDWSVTVVEQGQPADGATRHSAAVGVAHGAGPAQRELVRESLEGFATEPLLGCTHDLEALVVVSRAGLEALQEGIVTGRLPAAGEAERSALRRAYPDLVVDDDELVLTGRSVFTVDVDAIAEAALAPADGFECRTGTQAQRIARDGEGWRVELAAAELLSARRVAVATGPWPAPPLAAPGAAAPQAPRVKRVAALHLKPAPEGAPAVFFPEEDAFLLPRPGRLLYSFPRDAWLADGAAPAGGFDADDRASGVELLRRRSERLAAAVTGGVAFFDGYGPDRLPLVHAAAPGLVYLLGGSGSGVRLAPAIADRALSEMGSAAA